MYHLFSTPSSARDRFLQLLVTIASGIVVVVALRVIVPRGVIDSQVARSRPIPGGIFSVASGDGAQRGIAKVLVVGTNEVHIKMYSNLFPTHPSSVNELELVVLPITADVPVAGMEHLPLTRMAFGALDPIFIQQSSVRPEELEGYELWEESGGGLWNAPGISVPRGS